VARVVLTQPQPRVELLAGALSERGHEVVCLSFTRVRPLEVHGLAARLALVDWVVAVSPAALERLATLLGGTWPAGPGLALIGPGSLRALEQTGMAVPPERLSYPELPPFDALALLRDGPLAKPAGKRVLIVRGEGGRDDWIGQLREAGAAIEVQALYEREPVPPDPRAVERVQSWLDEPARVYCLFTQTGTAALLSDLPAMDRLRSLDGPTVVLAIHQRIADAASVAGFPQVRLIDPGEEAVIRAIE
jgi:uroporphyrinogen III methyltransferase/synthase